jgi:two-component system, NtrC family, response regulator AlgB
MMQHTEKTSLKILIADDDAGIRKTLSYCLSAEGHTVVGVGNAADAVYEARARATDMVFLDLKLGDEDGMGLIPVLLSDSPWIKIVVITAYASIETAITAIRQGAADYIAKPFTPDQVRLVTHRIGRIRELEMENSVLKENTLQSGPMDYLISKNHAMQQEMEILKKAAASEAIILFRGESGTGKSIFARAAHQWSSRSAKPMAVVSCPAIPSDLLESELFGHVKGAFTGAVRDNPGRIAACEGGTLFLDEIGDMAFAVQAKLLRFIQDKEFERVGDSIVRKADVRIIAATNADLEMKVSKGLFREDLFYRLNVISLTIPPLRERQEDILMLATNFLTHFCRTNHKTFLGFTDETKTFLLNYPWPGNIRELRNIIERAVILGNGERTEVCDLPGNIIPAAIVPSIGDSVPLSTIEELHIRRVTASAASLQEAADILGIDQATLWRKRKTYGI